MTNTSADVRQRWTGHVAVDDTRLAVTDHGGPGRPVLFLNGCYADQGHWRRVVDRLDPARFRPVLFDERGRGASATSTDYSFAACLRDIETVSRERGLSGPILVGWSYGAYLAVHHAAEHPDDVAGVVCVDGALPFGLTGEEGQAEIRRLFERVSWAFPIARRLGLAARMSAREHAEVNIESNEIGAHCGPLLRDLTVPVDYVLGTGGHLGADARVMEDGRATLDPILEANPRLRVYAKVACSHSKILARFPDVVAAAITDTAARIDRAPASGRS